MERDHTDRNDHDLLIKLDTRFNSVENMFCRMSDSINDKISQILAILNTKVDKNEFDTLKQQTEAHLVRIKDIEQTQRDAQVRKQFVVDLGSMGVRSWLFLTGAIITVITIVRSLSDK